jgi:translation initiation factor IF-2
MTIDTKFIELPDSLTVRELAQLINESPIAVIKELMNNGVMANINQQIDFDTAAIVCEEFGYSARSLAELEAEAKAVEEAAPSPIWERFYAQEDPEDLESRPPVATMLGHVDHGKTSLLDAIRGTNVFDGEAGGITQHVGAYQVTHRGHPITFLDTPGHEAFTAMRARGAQGADIAILVVAADDGVMPQTKEAIAHARAAKVPIIVALNKMDLPAANAELAKQQLAEADLVPDEWDGTTLVVPVSAKEKQGLDDLLEALLLVADETEIVANPNRLAEGTVIEGELDKSRGVTATLLIQNGTLHVSDTIVAGESLGRVRAMFDFRGQRILKASPSTPVSVLGLSDVPVAGEIFEVVENERSPAKS